MLGLPKATEIIKPLPKKAIFDKFKVSAAERKLFDEQINRLTIIAEISPHTVNIAASEEVSTIFVLLVQMKTLQCDKRNIILLSKLINQRMLFVLQYEGQAQLAGFHAGMMLLSSRKPINNWNISLSGLNLSVVWDNIQAMIGGFSLTGNDTLDRAIETKTQYEKLAKEIAALEKKLQGEKQFNRQVEMNGEMKKLKTELEDLH